MSDDRLTLALRDLAAGHRMPPVVPAAEIRRRAVRRRRMRRTGLAGSAAVGIAALTLALTADFGDEAPHTRPVRAAAPSDTEEPFATVDLERRAMTVDGRDLPVSTGDAKSPTPTGRMTVVAKYATQRLSATSATFGMYDMRLPWVVQLRTPSGGTNYIVALTFNEKAPGEYDATGGWIGLRTRDAKWLYTQVRPGDEVTVEGPEPANATTSAVPRGKVTTQPGPR
ncbi:L,D-transpeptidase [Streptomyces sp. NPDC091292]|uniref:L,D-transpeptidase n=1 Tax=Streptomyces sp. NPDC091292 TaxID=3365991 RepID=UPI003815E27C